MPIIQAHCEKCGKLIDINMTHYCHRSKTASNELLGGREADNQQPHEDGKLNSRPLGSMKCPECKGTGGRWFRIPFALGAYIKCKQCKGTGREAVL